MTVDPFTLGPRPPGTQRGATPATVLNVIAPLSAAEKRGARIAAKRWVIAAGLSKVDADELIAAMGAERPA